MLDSGDLASLLEAARWALVVTLHQVASGPEEDALVYSDYAAFDHDGMAEVAGVPAHWAVTNSVAIGL